MSRLSWDVIQERLIVCVHWGDGIDDDDWDELGDTLLRSRGEQGHLPMLVVSSGRGPTGEQLRRMRARVNGPQRIVFMTNAASTIAAAQQLASEEIAVEVVRPGDFGDALARLHLSSSLLTPVVVTVARLGRESRRWRESELTRSDWYITPRRMQLE